MSDVDDLKNNVALYKKLKDEADKRVKAAIDKARTNRQAQRDKQSRPI